MFGRDTVGAVVLDRAGNLAAGTSTGGMPHKPPGRVGDSPFIGAGLYADNETGAVSMTGHGERIIPLVLAKAAADLIGGGLDPQAAADRALATLARRDARGGLITLDRQGRVGVAWNTPAMAFAVRRAGAMSTARVRRPRHRGAAYPGNAYDRSRETSRNPIRRYTGSPRSEAPSTARVWPRATASSSTAFVTARPIPRRRASGTVTTL